MDSGILAPELIISSVYCEELQKKAQLLAGELQLAFEEKPTPHVNRQILYYTKEGLGLWRFQGKKLRFSRVLFINFLKGKSGYRLVHNRTIKQPLAKAVGIRPGIRPHIFDATAGMGSDAFVLASLGCNVQLCERSPIIASLLRDGIERAAATTEGQEITKKMSLLQGDSIALLPCKFDGTIYLDPMYPHTSSSAEKKLSMRIIRGLVGEDMDGEHLMAAAEACEAKRIVVKRPRLASRISKRQPQYVVEGKSCRYDVYL